jgi:hypothetical protein
MVISDALRSKRCLQPALLMAVTALAVLGSARISAGIQGSGRAFAAMGTVTGAGPGIITVDGTTYTTAGADFKIDGKSGKKRQLHRGDVVTVRGDLASAAEVTFNGNALGPVSGIDTQSGTFVVLAQTVRVNPDTLFGSAIGSLAGLQDGQVVEVSAFTDSTGALVATRVDIPKPSSLPQVVGVAQALDSTRETFRVNSLTINYSGAEVEGTFVAGSVVAARGARLAADRTLLASEVEVLPSTAGPPGTTGRIDGLITSLSSTTYFTVEHQPVSIDSNTKLHRKQPLGLDVRVKVTGTFDANGVLIASKVQSFK